MVRFRQKDPGVQRQVQSRCFERWPFARANSRYTLTESTVFDERLTFSETLALQLN